MRPSEQLSIHYLRNYYCCCFSHCIQASSKKKTRTIIKGHSFERGSVDLKWQYQCNNSMSLWFLLSPLAGFADTVYIALQILASLPVTGCCYWTTWTIPYSCNDNQLETQSNPHTHLKTTFTSAMERFRLWRKRKKEWYLPYEQETEFPVLQSHD